MKRHQRCGLEWSLAMPTDTTDVHAEHKWGPPCTIFGTCYPNNKALYSNKLYIATKLYSLCVLHFIDALVELSENRSRAQ